MQDAVKFSLLVHSLKLDRLMLPYVCPANLVTARNRSRGQWVSRNFEVAVDAPRSFGH